MQQSNFNDIQTKFKTYLIEEKLRHMAEITQQQKDMKKDYLFKQLKQSSPNSPPEWSVIWKEMLRSDGLKNRLEDLEYETVNAGEEFNEQEALQQIENEEKHRYFDLIEDYKYMNGDECWRLINLPRTVDPRKLTQLGIYWSIKEKHAEAHWGKHFGKPRFECLYEAIIDLNMINWAGTLMARMDLSLGEAEQEIRFLPNSKLFVTSVEVYDTLKDEAYHYMINKERRL